MSKAEAPPSFDTLRCSLSSSSIGACTVLPNAREPVPFETELFKGVCLLLIRSNPLDPFYMKHFEGKKREMEVQFQGTFKRMPEGDLYCGVEVSKRMELSMALLSTA